MACLYMIPVPLRNSPYSQILSISQASHLEYTWIGFGVVVLSLGRILRASYIEKRDIYIYILNTCCVRVCAMPTNAGICHPLLSMLLQYVQCIDYILYLRRA